MEGALYDEILTLSRTDELAQFIELNFERMGVATCSTALHLLARSAIALQSEQRRVMASQPWFRKMMMRLGSQLAGASDTDAQGLSSILWAMAVLEQNDNPLLLGLTKRLLLLAQHGRVSAAHLLLAAQSLAKLKMHGPPIGIALANLAQSRIAEFDAAQMGTMVRSIRTAPSHALPPTQRSAQHPALCPAPVHLSECARCTLAGSTFVCLVRHGCSWLAATLRRRERWWTAWVRRRRRSYDWSSQRASANSAPKR